MHWNPKSDNQHPHQQKEWNQVLPQDLQATDSNENCSFDLQNQNLVRNPAGIEAAGTTYTADDLQSACSTEIDETDARVDPESAGQHPSIQGSSTNTEISSVHEVHTGVTASCDSPKSDPQPLCMSHPNKGTESQPPQKKQHTGVP